MPTNPNMVAIQTVTVGSGGAASIDFTSIPQTYTDLVILCSLRSARTNGGADVIIRFNNSSTGYTNRRLAGTGSSVFSDTSEWTNGDSDSYTASTFSNAQFYIPNYTSSNNKSWSVDHVLENNATEAYATLATGLWSNSSAITSIKIYDTTNNNWKQFTSATLYGVTSSAYGAKATGGIITSDANYYYHTFLASGTFTPTSNITADYLVVAGGGGSGSVYGGGGGAGGLRCTVGATGGGGSLESALSLTASTNYTVTVGAGGAGATAGGAYPRGSAGSDSVFGSITSTGGGGGGSSQGTATGGNGGSGGGGSNTTGTAGGTGTANQGYAGAGGSTSSPNYGAGGGGGAGAAGGSGTGTVGGNGGNGVTTAISGTSTTYAGGGGGATFSGGTAGTGGTGGGGNAGAGGTDNIGTAGTANRGGGGGGSAYNSTLPGPGGAAGGSGIVIVRYSK
jgi:hypothetical protein